MSDTSDISTLLSAECPEYHALYSVLSGALQVGYSSIECTDAGTVPDIGQWCADDEIKKTALIALKSHPEKTPYSIKKNNRIYFTHIYERHEQVARWYREHCAALESEETNVVRLCALEQYSKGVITKEQEQAICAMGARRICPVFGGPGTGKSYVAVQFLRAYLEAHAHQKTRICLAGPTGKAAHLLYEGVERHLGVHKDHIEAMTLHSLLGLGQGKAVPTTQLPFHIVIVDEASMLDEQMALLLFQRLGKAKLILLGDPYQLPPISPGDAFQTIKEIEQEQGSYLELTECKRIEAPKILTCAGAIRDGNEEVLQQLFGENNEAVRFVEVADDSMECFLESRKKALLQAFSVDTMKAGHRLPFVLLSPCKRGTWGLDHVNTLLSHRRNAQEAVPIIVTKNNYDVGVMNGEVGVQYRGELFFPSGKRIPEQMLPNHDLGYCISVHKSQGSEFERVIILLPQSAERFDARMLYTAITRAKKGVEIWGSKERLFAICGQNLTSLKAS